MNIDIYTRWFEPSKKQINPIPDYPAVRIIRIPSGPWEFIPKEQIYGILPELAENMVNFIQKHELHYDLFHGHYVDAGIVALNVAQAFDKPAFFTAHSLGAWKREQMGGNPDEMEEKYNFNHRIAEELRIFKTVNAQTVTTQIQLEKLDQLYGFSADNIVVIPPGVDVHSFRPLQPRATKMKTDFPEPYIFCLSRIDTNKGHDLLLYAFDKVRQKISDIHLIIGGGSPKPHPRELEVLDMMRKIIDEVEMSDRAHLIGYVPDDRLIPYYQQAKLFVLPSLFEPFGMTVLEAMACGTPVIASKMGGIRNTITSGKNGLLIDPTNANEFAEAIITLLRNSEMAKSVGSKGYETIQQFFSWEAIAERHITFYCRFM